MAEEEIIPEVEQQQQPQQLPPQLQPQKEEEKRKRGRPPKQPQKKQQQQQQQEIKIDDAEIPEKERKNKMSPEDTKVFRILKDTYKFSYKDQVSISRAYYGDYLFVVRKISDGRKDYDKENPYVVVRIKKGDDKNIIKKENDEKILIPYFRFNNEFFNTKGNREKFIKFIKDDKYKFDKKKPDGHFDSADVRRNGILNFEDVASLNNIPNYEDPKKIFPDGENNDGLFDDEGFDDDDNEEKPIEEKPIKEKKKEPLPKEHLPKEEDIEIDNDIYNSDSDRMTDIDEEYTDTDEEELIDADVRGKDNQLIAGHTPNGEELRALIKYNNNSDSLLKLIVSLSNDNKGEVDFKEIGEIQDLNGDITNLYSKMQDLKTKINSSNNAEEKERLLIKYNEKRLKLEDLIKKYSKEAYRLSMLNKKKKATFSNPNYIKNKLNKL